MPEALALSFVFIVSSIAYVAAKIHARDPSVWNAKQELERLRLQRSNLEQRLQVAEMEGWDSHMRSHIVEQLRTTRIQFAHMAGEMDEPVER